MTVEEMGAARYTLGGLRGIWGGDDAGNRKHCRAAMSVLFIYGGWGKLLAPAATQAMLASHDLPMVQFGWILAVVVELGGGLAILFGLFTRPVGLVLAI